MKLSKTQSLTTTEDRERMKVIPYDTAIGSIKACPTVYQTYSVPCHEFGRGYSSDLGVDPWTMVKIILRYFKED